MFPKTQMNYNNHRNLAKQNKLLIILSEILNEFLLLRKTAGKLKPNKKLSLELKIKRTIKRR